MFIHQTSLQDTRKKSQDYEAKVKVTYINFEVKCVLLTHNPEI